MFTEGPSIDHTAISTVISLPNESGWNYSVLTGGGGDGDLDSIEDVGGSLLDGEDIAQFIYSIDICLAFFSCLNLIVNVWLLMLSFGFVRNGCSSSTSDNSERRPHYGLHLFIFNCAVSSVLLEGIGVVTNIGFLFVGGNIFVHGIDSESKEIIVKKIIDFLTYGLFNVTHLNFVLLLNVDKLLYILRPLHYHQLMSRRRVCIICIVTWCAALAMASPSLTYVDENIRQEAILFAMCVVCPVGFDLISAIIVSTIVYRIQLRDSNTRRSVMGHRNSHSGGGHVRTTTITIQRSTQPNGVPVRTLRHRTKSTSETFSRHCNVFLRTFTPIIWTCVTTLPYTSTMIYLYFGSDGDEDFNRRWLDPTTFKSLRAFGCLYITYFTGVPFIIVFNYLPYRRKIKLLTRLISKRLHSLHRRVYTHRYEAVTKQDNNGDVVIGVTSNNFDGQQHTVVTAL